MKTKINFLIALTAFFIISGCASKQVAFFPTSEVTYQNYSGDILTLRVLGYGGNENTAIEDAQMRAMETLFFRGIPNSNISNPLIGFNENELKRTHNNYFKDFFGYKRYLTFISETMLIGGQKQKVIATKVDKKSAKQDMVDALVVAVDVLVNVKNLRKDLEDQNIVRKFGF
ncbi:MAG: hypothetical protein GW772_09795 [Flavobacteriia bacterium]|nr:hypothetical protein [Flavobacteriia bacterium]OIP46514.1 MAG: hypothetical protein AUK46_08205 [Flavobacteriaceae bacterium CG2_30_31_66]PIV96457.1 MAG: hypothetical protein COW43_08050 [Flavobacteriaceae bacterium CG17_big_fil_post_rev_8_21_14_2_50_31_13]PIX14549.1 MAG: hypothetical protein COZ74_02635 [Flavobacteriaceae bacterium CG_4_8_14_3_um_filter_31_8]PIY15078.1 MAG: hypothetical protein COZ16_05705 [Flavobacteriaceae bacterium CG_4_10_14_3_um_filter_31_253]PIZ09718.1 MAG: hypotheti